MAANHRVNDARGFERIWSARFGALVRAGAVNPLHYYYVCSPLAVPGGNQEGTGGPWGPRGCAGSAPGGLRVLFFGLRVLLRGLGALFFLFFGP